MKAVKPRIKYDVSRKSTISYYIQPSLAHGTNGGVDVTRTTNLEDSLIEEAHRPLVKAILALPGIVSLTVYDKEIRVVKGVAYEWLEDGIHERVLNLIISELYADADEVEVIALDGCGFHGEESEDDREETVESLFEEIFSVQLADIASAVCETIDTIEIRQSETTGSFDQRDTEDMVIKIKFKG